MQIFVMNKEQVMLDLLSLISSMKQKASCRNDFVARKQKTYFTTETYLIAIKCNINSIKLKAAFVTMNKLLISPNF